MNIECCAFKKFRDQNKAIKHLEKYCGAVFFGAVAFAIFFGQRPLSVAGAKSKPQKKNARGCILPKQNSAINKIASLQRLVLNLILSNFQIDMLYTYQKTPIDEW